MLLLGSLLLSSPASAQTIETPWGPISTRQAEMLCAADHVFVGKITNVTPLVPNDGFFPDRINSIVGFSVERNVRASGSHFIIQLPGGNLDGVRHLVEGYPIPLTGRRYLMVVDRWPRDVGPAHEGDLRYFFSVALDASVVLPPVEALRDAMRTVCQDLPRGDPSPDTTPTTP